MYSYSKFEHSYTKSYFKHTEPVSDDYRVFLNGEEIPVYTCRISKYPFNTVWPGHQRPIEQSEQASYVNIVSDEEVRIEVISNLACERVLLKPYSKHIEHTEAEGKITFSLKENGCYVLECDSYHHCLYIFNSRPVAAPAENDVTYYFGAGIYFPGKIILKSNESVYIDKDALVYGCLYAENAENIHVFGNGILDDSGEERFNQHCYEAYTNGNMKFYDCKNIKIEGVGMKNSAAWCLNLFGCFDVYVDNIKIFGQWRYNTDGIDIVNSQNVYINNSFIHSFDDTITIKGIDRYAHIDNVNIHVDHCVMWCDWGKCCEVGIETACREYKNISFRNCDILRGGGNALDIGNGDCAEIHDVVFENINVEYNSFDTESVFQEKDADVYDKENTITIPKLIVIRNWSFRNPEDTALWGLPPLTDMIDLNGIQQRMVHDVTIKNVHVFYDEGMPLKDSKPIIVCEVFSEDDTDEFYNISISGITVNNGGKIYDSAIWTDGN